MDEDIRLTVRSEPRLLASIRCLVRGWVERHGIAKDLVNQVVLAIDEACSNAIRHAYEGRGDEVMELALRSTPEHLEIVLCDCGVPCSADKSARRRVEAPSTENLCPGGIGVQLIYEVFDEVEFRPGKTCGNCVTMRLKRPQ